MTNLQVIAAALLEGGAVALDLFEPRDLPLHEQPTAAIDETMVAVDRAARVEAPGEPPAYNPEAARWGLERLNVIARLLIDREATDEVVEASLEWSMAQPLPDANDPGAIWSVDLSLRHLPALSRQALSLVPSDSAVQEIERLCVQWPLSGVGRRSIDRDVLAPALPEPTEAIQRVPALRRMFQDRLDLASGPVH